MIQKVFYGESNALTATMKDISFNEKLVLSIIVVLIFVVGIYPQPFFDLTKQSVALLVAKFK